MARKPGEEREKAAAAVGAAWVMETFLWGPRTELSGYPQAHMPGLLRGSAPGPRAPVPAPTL